LFASENANTVGGTTAAARNVISGNGNNGVELDLAGTTANLLQGNLIGLDVSASSALANGASGVHFDHAASGNTVGGLTAPERNQIAFNGGAGVTVDGNSGGAHGDAILRNSIVSNGGLGIALVNGGNASQPAPVITGVSTVGGTTTITGTLSGSAPSTVHRLEFFASGSC